MRLTIELSDDEEKILKERAEKNFLSLKEQVEDIVRRSCINSKKKQGLQQVNVDDKLISIFSRERKGRHPKKKNKKKKQK